MLPHITNAEDEVLHDLVLNFKIPVLHHAGASIRWQQSVDRVLRKVLERGIFRVRWRCVGGETGIQGLHRSKVVATGKGRINGGTAGQKSSEVGIAQWRIVDAVSSPNHGVGHKVRRPRKPDPWANVLQIGAYPSGIRSKDQSAWLARRARVGRGKGKIRLRTRCFMTRRIDIPAQAEVGREVVPNFDIILYIQRVIVLIPAWEVRIYGQIFALWQANEKTGNRITRSTGLTRSPSGLVVLEDVVGGCVPSGQDGKLKGSPFTAKAQRVAPLCPGNAIRHDQAVGVVIVVVPGTHAKVADPQRVAVEL